MLVKNEYSVGDWVTVVPCAGGYSLPVGLPDGARVKVVALDIGYDKVEYQGQLFTVAMACVDSGHTRIPD